MEFGIQGLLGIVLNLIFIVVSWYALQSFKIDLFVKHVNGVQTKLLLILLSIFIGHGVASFFIDYLTWSLMLKTIF